MLDMFYREPKVSRASVRRIRWIDVTKACVIERVQARIRRWHADHQPEVPTPA
jgi:hypothetical protein